MPEGLGERWPRVWRRAEVAIERPWPWGPRGRRESSAMEAGRPGPPSVTSMRMRSPIATVRIAICPPPCSIALARTLLVAWASRSVSAWTTGVPGPGSRVSVAPCAAATSRQVRACAVRRSWRSTSSGVASAGSASAKAARRSSSSSDATTRGGDLAAPCGAVERQQRGGQRLADLVGRPRRAAPQAARRHQMHAATATAASVVAVATAGGSAISAQIRSSTTISARPRRTRDGGTAGSGCATGRRPGGSRSPTRCG